MTAPDTADVVIGLVSDRGDSRGTMTLSAVGKRRSHIARLVDLRQATGNGPGASAQLLEDDEYHFDLDLDNGLEITSLEPSTIISAGPRLVTGRIRTGRNIGAFTFRAEMADGSALTAELEIRSRKLDYETEYRQMLDGIASRTTELLEDSASPTELRNLNLGASGTSQTTYQRFVFLRGLIDSEEVKAALARIQRAPHTTFSPEERSIDPARGVRPSARVAREITRPGPRQPTPGTGGTATTLPKLIRVETREADLDTVPNRFIRWVLEQWAGLVHDVERHLDDSSGSARLLREVRAMADVIAAARDIPAMRNAGRLTQIPSSDQVLQNRAGYREILRAFMLANTAGCIDWELDGTLFGAGLRDVAELYEYWTYLELVDLVRHLDGFTIDMGDLIELDADRFTLRLRRSRDVSVVARGIVRHTPVTIAVWFNKSFGRTDGDDGTWSLKLRPDCSIRISANGRSTWVHFDAKYRVDLSKEGFKPYLGDEPDVPEQVDAGDTPTETEDSDTADDSDAVMRRAPTAGVVKMHAYHDAIRHSAGAYVLYPGDQSSNRGPSLRLNRYSEIVPGIGSFVMNPGTWGRAGDPSQSDLREFLLEVIDFLVADGTQFSRDEYWTRTIRSGDVPTRRDPLGLDGLPPPADTTVLIGYVRDPANLEWVERTGWYNLRADPWRGGTVEATSSVLHTHLVLLHWIDGEGNRRTRLLRRLPGVALKTATELIDEGYVNPGGETYFCVAIDPAPITHPSGDHWHHWGLGTAPRLVTLDQI